MHVTTRRTSVVSKLDLAGSASELATALSVITFFQGAVQHADDKVRTVVAAQSMVTALVIAQWGFLPRSYPLVTIKIATLTILMVFAAGYVYSSFHLVQALRPRTTPPSKSNRFSFPSVASRTKPLGVASLREQCIQAHEVSQLLANLAMIKHHHVRRALLGACTLFASGVSLFVLAAIS